MARLIPSTAEAAAALTERMDEIVLRGERENRALSDAENTELSGLMARAKKAVEVAEERRSFSEAFARTLGTPSGGDTGLLAREANGAPRETRQAPGSNTPLVVPSLAEYRAQAEGTDSAGGYTVPVEQAQFVIDRLRPRSVFLESGPRILTMHSDQLRVPKIGTSSVVSMVSENAEIPASDIVFASALFTARKLAGLVRASNEWLSDSVPDARVIVEQDLLRQMGTVLDTQLFTGSGVAPNLLGIVNAPGVNATAITGPLTLDAVSQAIERIQIDNGNPNAIFVSPAVWGGVQRLKDTDARYQLGPDPSMDSRRQLFGVPIFVTPAVGNVAVIADMSQVGVGVRNRWVTHYDPYRYSEFDQSAVRLTSRWDVAVLNAAAVELLTGLT